MSNDEEIDRREAVCREVVLSAGEIARRGYVQRSHASVDLKGPQDFLTETDAAVEEHLKTRLAEAFPDDGFFGEETGRSGLADSIWVVDPIDGTANFARLIPHFCISIAYISGGRIELGAIYNPALDELHFARRGRGAERNGVPIRVSDTTDPHAACVELGWSTRVPNHRYLAAMEGLLAGGANIRRGASGALGLAYVADGRSDGYAELHMQPWDCLAGLLLVAQAGGIVAPFLEVGGLGEGGAVLAATPALAARISRATGIALDIGEGNITNAPEALAV